MRLLFLNDTITVGGGEVWVARMARALTKVGHRCFVGAPSDAPMLELAPDDVGSLRYSSLDALSFVPRLRSFVDEHGIDAIVCTLMGRHLECPALREVVATSRRPPQILLKMGLPPYPDTSVADYGYGVHRAFRRLLVVCDHNREAFLEQFPNLPSPYVRTLYTGIDLESHRDHGPRSESLRRELGMDARDPLIVNAARVSFLKGQAFLVQAAAGVMQRHPRAHLLLVGDGHPEDIRNLRAVVHGLGLDARIHFLEYRRDVRDVLASATVYVQPSLLEGIPNALLEAMALGRACVATAVCGVPELVTDGQALLVPPYDITALAHGIETLLMDEDLRRSMGTRAIARARDFSIADRAAELIGLLNELREPAIRASSVRVGRAGPGRGEHRTRPSARGVLIAQAEGMGDQILAYPFLQQARRIYADREMTLLIPQGRERLFTHIGFDECLAYTPATMRDLQSREFELAFDLNLRPEMNLAKAGRTDLLVSFPKEDPPTPSVSTPLQEHVPLWRQFLGLLRADWVRSPDVAWDELGPTATDAERTIAGQLLGGVEPQTKVVAVTPGGYSPTRKRWAPERFAEVLNTLGETVPLVAVLLGHPREVDLAWDLERLLSVPTLNLVNRYPGLGVLMALLQRTHLHLSNDNGVMHLADAMDVAQVVLFGPTNHRLFGPMRPGSRLVISPTEHMEDIDPCRVLAECETILRNGSARRRSG